MGVNSGDYDAAAVASDVFHRMGSRGQVKEDDFRVIYRSQKFPTSSFSYAHDLEPKFRDQMLKCFYDYRFTRFEDHSAAWWKRELRGTTPPLSLDSFRR